MTLNKLPLAATAITYQITDVITSTTQPTPHFSLKLCPKVSTTVHVQLQTFNALDLHFSSKKTTCHLAILRNLL